MSHIQQGNSLVRRCSIKARSACFWPGLLGSLVVGGTLAGYALRIEPRRLEIVPVNLPFPRLPRAFDGLTIAQISDIHAGRIVNAAWIHRIVKLTNSLRADMVVVTGDMFQNEPWEAQMCATALGALQAPLGVYAIMGNHERRIPARLGEMPFRRAGLRVLCNAAEQIRLDGASLWLVGVDDILARRGDLLKATRGIPPEDCRILLAHEPDYVEMVQREVNRHPYLGPIDVQLSGHAHGGQVRLPGIGPLLLPVLGRKYPMGLYRLGETWLYASRGVGVTSPPVRFGCRPEITLFTLQKRRL